MAATPQGRAATTAHKLAQGRVAARVVADVLSVWQGLDPLRLADPGWSASILAALARHRPESAELAANYYDTFRRAEIPAAPPHRASAGTSDPWRARAVTSLRVTGTRVVARLISGGMEPALALDKAGPGVAAALARHVLAAGRSTLDAAMRADPVARGWLRITDADPCWWCAMLASRGAVYLSKASASARGGTNDEYHDGCGCQPEPFFRIAVLPETSQRFAGLWETSTDGLSGKDARTAFRRAHAAARRV